jgi:prepilin signal peptidase PulO-like enzyme (type II secretory pathway)
MLIPAIALFIIGSFFGSFLSVLIYRIRKEKKGIFLGKSECPYCHKRLKIRDLVPIFSYILQRGRCRMCKNKISAHYLFLEIITGLIFVTFYLEYTFVQILETNAVMYDLSSLYAYVFYAVMSLFLIAIWFYDLKYLEIPQIFVIPPILLVLFSALIFPEPGILSMLTGAAVAIVFFGAQVLISKETWMGLGDMYVGVLIGLLLGWQYFIMCLIFAYLIGSISSMVLLLGGRLNMKSQVPFAPFLVIATFITLFFGDFFYDLYLQTLL